MIAPSNDYANVVQSLYVAYFGRPADFFGLQNFSAALNAVNAPTTLAGLESAYETNTAVKALIDSFGSSAESTSLYSGTSVQFISSIYQNILGRAPDFEGLLFWSSAIDSGQLSKGNAALAIATGALNNNSPQGQIDAAVFTNKVTVASNFTDALDTLLEINGYAGANAAAQARSLLSTVTVTDMPDGETIQHTITTIACGPGMGLPAPAPVTAVTNSNAQITLDADFTIAKPQSGAAPGCYADVLSYSISDHGEITFTGTLANSLTPEQKAGEILAILKNMPGTACSFVQHNNQTNVDDTYLICTGTGTTGPAVIDIVGVAKHGVDGMNIETPMHFSG